MLVLFQQIHPFSQSYDCITGWTFLPEATILNQFSREQLALDGKAFACFNFLFKVFLFPNQEKNIFVFTHRDS